MRLRTGYSFRTAIGFLPEIINKLKAQGSKFAPISDRTSTFAYVEWAKLAKEVGLAPIYGVELAVVPELGAKQPIISFWSFFAKDDLKPLHELIYLATSNPGREPSLLYKHALEASRNGLIAIAGERTLISEIVKHSDKKCDVFLALSPSTPKGLVAEAVAAKVKLIRSDDNYYTNSEDLELYRVMLGRHAGTQIYPRHILSDDEWKAAVEPFTEPKWREQAVKNYEAALKRCKAELKRATLLTPEKPKTLRQMCVDGAKVKGCNLKDPVYKERLDRELALIAEKQYEDYFFIIADLVKWAKARMIVGPARGSSCGSLVCYLLDITTIDPIPFNLIFERFIDITRKDLPDIDLDFSDERRQLVFDYAEQKYGAERVARLGTVGMFKPRSALKQAGMALQVPGWKTDKVLDSLIVRSSGDSRALNTLEDTLKGTEAGKTLMKDHPEVLIAARFEGHPNNASQHAAGIVITQEPVINYVAVDARTKATMCDKYDAETLNLLKIDALGLTQLSIFERTLQLVGKPDVSGYLETLPLDDQMAFDVLNDGKISGIFQFTGMALRSLTKQIKIKHIEDMISITALARPGPMATGGANSWVKRRVGMEKVSYPHPVFEPYLKETLGIVAYQEQVMQIGRQVGDLSWEDVTALRKAMSKSLGKEYFDQFGDRWKKAAAKKGIPKENLEKIWDDLCAFGAWAFNRSHAVAYGLVSYYCCWLKAHHPVEFAAATLDAEKDPGKQIAMLRELALEGIDYVSIDVDHSVDRWAVAHRNGKQFLVGPLTAIKGVGPATLHEILEARKAKKELRPALAKKLANAKTEIDSLTPIADRIKAIMPDPAALKISSVPEAIINVQCGLHGDIVIFGVAKKIAPRDENEAVNIAKRGGRIITGPTQSLNMFIGDDTDEIFCKIDRFRFEELGRPITEKGRPGKSLYALKGTCPPDFRMLKVTNVRYIGELDG